MKNFVAAIAAVASLLGSLAQAEIPPQARVLNKGGYCAWASLDTMARANGIRSLVGIFEDRRKSGHVNDPGYDSLIIAELKARGVRYELRPFASYDRKLLENYADQGVMVSLLRGNPWSIGCHAIVVTRYDGQLVEFYDSSKPTQGGQPKTWTCGRDWFDRWWTGASVAVFGESGELVATQ
jgi:hypothetical protein